MKNNRRQIPRDLDPGIETVIHCPNFDPVALLHCLRKQDPGRPLIHIDRERSTGWSHIPVEISGVVEDEGGERVFDHPLLAEVGDRTGPFPRSAKEGVSPFSSGIVLLFPFELAEAWEPTGGPFSAPSVPAIRIDCPRVVSFHAPSGRLFLPPGLDPSLLAPSDLPAVASSPSSLPLSFNPGESDADFMSALQKVRQGLEDGRYFQVNLARRFSADLPEGFDPLAAYARMRALGSSAFGGFFSWRELFLLSRSPEQFLAANGERIVTRPIAGTAPGPEPEGEEPLLRDPKLLAEHVMTVDLLRNDLGRVCRPGSVGVPRFLGVERLPHLRHLVSDVEGRLAPGISRTDLLRSLFPGGSVTGAPRIAVRREIGLLEGRPRNYYCGAFGYVSGSGQADLSLLIRTLEGDTGRGRISFGAGAGIVADSVAEDEIREIALKARTMEEVFR